VSRLGPRRVTRGPRHAPAVTVWADVCERHRVLVGGHGRRGPDGLAPARLRSQWWWCVPLSAAAAAASAAEDCRCVCVCVLNRTLVSERSLLSTHTHTHSVYLQRWHAVKQRWPAAALHHTSDSPRRRGCCCAPRCAAGRSACRPARTAHPRSCVCVAVVCGRVGGCQQQHGGRRQGACMRACGRPQAHGRTCWPRAPLWRRSWGGVRSGSQRRRRSCGNNRARGAGHAVQDSMISDGRRTAANGRRRATGSCRSLPAPPAQAGGVVQDTHSNTGQ
jgi:hypothetical protein